MDNTISNGVHKHIILIGFKNVGKSAIGSELASQIGRQFVDLDEQIQKNYALKNSAHLNCRQIMLKEGQKAFREMEHEALKQVLCEKQPAVIALGGGTPIYEKNNPLLKGHQIIQITAPKAIVYERIIINGRPAFFSPDEHPLESFNRIWDEREGIYNSLSKIRIDNSKSVREAVNLIKPLIKNLF